MLKYINYQLHSEQKIQQQLERDAAIQINKRLKANLAAFSQHIPSIIPLIQAHKIQQYSLFCTKQGEMNIVDFATGRVWYSDSASLEVAAEVISFCQKAPFTDLSASNPSEHEKWPTEPIPTSIDVLIMFGLGLGYQLNDLLSKVKIKYLIVYEPSLDVLFCSLQANDWQKTFDILTKYGAQIFLQVGNAVESIVEDLNELNAITKLERVHVYRHYFHATMDKVVEHLLSGRFKLGEQNVEIASFLPYDNFSDSVAERADNVLGNQVIKHATIPDEIFHRNLSAFEQFYPKVFEQLKKYENQSWSYILDENGKTNLLHKNRKALFYSDIDVESENIIHYFSNNASQENVLLSQRSTGKFNHYIHFSSIEKVENLLDKDFQKKMVLPADVSSLVIFGVCLGKHIDLLVRDYTIQNLYIFEPNLDFFYASLYVMDWEGLFSRAEQRGQRVYLNLGGDGTDYFKDLISQFYLAGPYSIADTYILTSYYNKTMHKAIVDLRSELRVALALGEYYDHVRYGIAHTYNSLVQGHRFLKADRSLNASATVLNIPIFIVGNGPSLDSSFEYLKEYRDRVIIVSCGTALFSLFKNGITPDFHAEIEQNRATYCWVNRVDDKSYLKNIRLISVNGIHPETAELFKEVVLCFKSGEASTRFFDRGLKKQGFNIASISYAYPTVSNLSLNYFLDLGFKSIYLFGVDLGYADVKYHHSKFSAYYKNDGSEIFDFEKRHGKGRRVKGNFYPFVFTKPEFDMSRKLLEEAIKKNNRSTEIYNCSNGVRIEGATPLKLDHILIGRSHVNKEGLISSFVDEACYKDLKLNAEKTLGDISFESFFGTMTKWSEILNQDVNTQGDAKRVIAEQWELLYRNSSSDNDPTSYLFQSSFNYFGGVMVKVASSINEDNDEALICFNKIKEIWSEYLVLASSDFSSNPIRFDNVDVTHLFS